MRVLIIDDDRVHGESLSELLETRGHEAYFAPTLDEARWLLDLFRFRLAILDHDMPDATGLEVAAALHSIDPGIQPVLMSANDENRRRAAAAGLTPFLSKPIAIEGLLDLMGEIEAGTSIMLRVAYPVAHYRRGSRR